MNAGKGKCLVIGHRGAMGYAPENTLASFELALKMGVDAVECDVHLSKEGNLIVIHDDSIDRTTAGTGLIQNLTTRELKKFDAGAWFKKEFRAGGVENTLSAAVLEGGSQRSSTRAKRVVQRSSTRAERAVSFRGEKIPRLKYLLGWARKRTTQNGFPLGVIIEIKNESRRYPKIAHHVIEAIQSEYMRERVIVISFDRGVLNQMKQLNSTIETGLLYRDRIPNPIHSARRLKAGAIFPRRHLVRRSLIERAHKAHLKVFT